MVGGQPLAGKLRTQKAILTRAPAKCPSVTRRQLSCLGIIAFLPITGCDEGGSYGTGVRGHECIGRRPCVGALFNPICSCTRPCYCGPPISSLRTCRNVYIREQFVKQPSSAGRTENCVKLYQPAAEAERRFKEKRDGATAADGKAGTKSSSKD